MMKACNSMDSMDSLSTVVSDYENGVFEIGEADDDLTTLIQEPKSHTVEIIEEPRSPKRRLSVSDQILGQVQKLLKKTTADGGLEYLPYNSGVTEYQPTVRQAKYEPILACDDYDESDKKHNQRCMPGYAAHHGPSLIPAELKENWNNFVTKTPTAAPRLSVAPPADFKWGFKTAAV